MYRPNRLYNRRGLAPDGILPRWVRWGILFRQVRSKTMNNIMTIDGHKALIQYDPKTELFRSEFIGLNEWIGRTLDRAVQG